MFFLFCKYFLLFYLISCERTEIDISWDFEKTEIISGWGNSTSEQTEIEHKVDNGELQCRITGLSPMLESPNLLLNITHRHYAVFRMRYVGSANSARLLLRSGSVLSPNQQLLTNTAYWSERIKISAITDSGTVSVSNDRNHLVDGVLQSYFLSTLSTGVFVVFDLGDSRWINTFRILPIGDSRSPKRCVLQQSLTTGVGPFETVVSFTLTNKNTIEEQIISGFNGYARYWRLIAIDNYGGVGIGIREVYFDGYEESVAIVPFEIDSSGKYQNYYLPINSYLRGMLLKMRLELFYSDNIRIKPYYHGKKFYEKLSIDYIRIARAPEIWKVVGCLDQYFQDENFLNPEYNVTTVVEVINNNLPLFSFTKNNITRLQYASTYDCPLQGNILISIQGINFGLNAVVTVGDTDCPVLTNTFSTEDGRQQTITCNLPPMTADREKNYDLVGDNTRLVKVSNGVLPGLFHEVPYLRYRVAPSVPDVLTVTNIGAHKVDLVWSTPGDVFNQITITGYKIIWLQPKFPTRVSNMTVGNVTTTSVRGLHPSTEYVFAIAAIAEGHENADLPTDLYGRREILEQFASMSNFSIYTNITATVAKDFDFNFFNGNATLNHSNTAHLLKSLGPTGQYNSEGQYGLVMVGSSNIENCNVSSTCCDGFNATIGMSSCGQFSNNVCAVFAFNELSTPFVIGDITRFSTPSNVPHGNGSPSTIQIVTLDYLVRHKGAPLPSNACGPSLRLTDSSARQSGSTWYARKMNVQEGFVTSFRFRVSNPSQKCDRMDDVHTYCRSRGADGLAFVVQNEKKDALGLGGKGLGYENADFINGGQSDWSVGFGLLYIYIDDLFLPVITTPLNIDSTLHLDHGRAFVGFTAATGDAHWQVHDVLDWQFESLYIDEIYVSPNVVNGQGAFTCMNDSVCSHYADVDHFVRKNNEWGSGTDNTEGWQNGKEGYCAFC